jgi:hypothetical protein
VIARDLPRAALLRRSLGRFARGLGTLWVVTPDAERDGVAASLAREPVPGLREEVVAETALVPELRLLPWLRGWYRQQLVKLAAADRVRGSAYLALDADVVMTRPAGPSELAPGGRALYAVLHEDSHPDWYDASEAVLGLPAPRRGVLHAVTPAMLSVGGVRELQDFLERKVARGLWSGGARGLRQRAAVAAVRALETGRRLAGHAARPPLRVWRAYLAASFRFTEYALYFTFLEATGAIDRHHVLSATPLYDVARSVWKRDAATFDAWDPAPLFGGAGPPYFVVVQSVAGVEVERVARKLAPWLPPR